MSTSPSTPVHSPSQPAASRGLSDAHFGYFLRSVSGLLCLYGVGTLLVYAVFVITGTNSLASVTNGMGLLFFGLAGAFALPLGLAMWTRSNASDELLRVASMGLFINGLLRLSLLASPTLRDAVGVAAPITEFAVFSLLSYLTMALRPASETVPETSPNPV